MSPKHICFSMGLLIHCDLKICIVVPFLFPEETLSQPSNRQRFKKSRIWIRYNGTGLTCVAFEPLPPPQTLQTKHIPQQSTHSFHFISLTTSHIVQRQPCANLITRLHSRHCHTMTLSFCYYFFYKLCSLGWAAELCVVPRLNPFSRNL